MSCIGGPRQHGSFLLSFYLLRNTKRLMTRTYSLSFTKSITVAFFVAMLFMTFVVPAHADSAGRASSGGHSGDHGPGGPAGESSKKGLNNGKSEMSLDQRLEQLKTKIEDLGNKKDELMTLLNKVKDGRASSTPNNSGSDNWKDRLCKAGGGMENIAIPGGVRDRICDKGKHGTSTDERGSGHEKEKCIPRQASSTSQSGRDMLCEKKNATTTPIFKVTRPNKGTVHTRPNDKSVLIEWRDTVGVATVDIDLKKGSTTTSIAKDVKGKKANGMSGAVLGAMSAGTSNAGGGDGGGNSMGVREKHNPGKVFSYRWKNAPVGEGYKIVITGKKDGKTYTDESDATFSVKASPRGLDFKKHESETTESGDVLGAETVSYETLNETFEDILAELSVGLASH